MSDLAETDNKNDSTELNCFDNNENIDESNAFNKTWLDNKNKIVEAITSNTNNNLKNYGTNLIVFYENKIKSIKKLKESKVSDAKKNFIGDITIQDKQLGEIQDIGED